MFKQKGTNEFKKLFLIANIVALFGGGSASPYDFNSNTIDTVETTTLGNLNTTEAPQDIVETSTFGSCADAPRKPPDYTGLSAITKDASERLYKCSYGGILDSDPLSSTFYLPCRGSYENFTWPRCVNGKFTEFKVEEKN